MQPWSIKKTKQNRTKQNNNKQQTNKQTKKVTEYYASVPSLFRLGAQEPCIF